MKVAYCCNEFYGYSETFIRDLVKGLQDNECDVSVFASKQSQPCPDGIAVFEHKLKSQPNFLLRIIAQLYSLLGSSRDTYLKKASFRKYEKCVYSKIEIFAPDVLYADYGTVGVLLLDLAEKMNIPLVIHFHGFDATSALRSSWYLNRIKKLTSSKYQVIVPSEHIRRVLSVSAGLGNKKMSVIPCIPSMSRARELTHAKKADAPTVVAVGRLTPKKNPL